LVFSKNIRHITVYLYYIETPIHSLLEENV